MKKLLVVLLILAVACTAVFAAGGKDSGMPKIGVTVYKFDDTFMSLVRNAIQKNAAGKATIEVVDSQNSQPAQNDQVDQFIAKKVNALAINPVDRTACATIIGKAKAANIPVVFYNRQPLEADYKLWDKVYYVGAKAEDSGTYQGQIAVKYFKENPAADKNKDGVIQYVMLKGEPGHQDAEARTAYSVKAITDSGAKVQKLAEDTAMWDRVKGQEKMAAFLAANGDKIELILANNDDMALGAIAALQAAGYNTGSAKYIPVIGVDATPPALQAVENGSLLGTVLNDAANQGKATFDLAYTLAQGKPAADCGWKLDGRDIWVPYQMVTKDNYKNFK